MDRFPHDRHALSMDMRMTRATALGVLAAAMCPLAEAAVTGHWDFSGNLFARVGAVAGARHPGLPVWDDRFLRHR